MTHDFSWFQPIVGETAHRPTVAQAEHDFTNALASYLKRLRSREATQIDWNDFPIVRSVRLYLGLVTVSEGSNPS